MNCPYCKNTGVHLVSGTIEDGFSARPCVHCEKGQAVAYMHTVQSGQPGRLSADRHYTQEEVASVLKRLQPFLGAQVEVVEALERFKRSALRAPAGGYTADEVTELIATHRDTLYATLETIAAKVGA